MDAKPQRPRTARAQGDENVAPQASKQTIHQRHKSAGNLSTMLNNVTGLKAAAKRTAFGDVSNIVKQLPSAQDKSAAAVEKHGDFVKPLVLTDKSTGFLRPAQRPLNLAGPKVTVPSQSAQSAVVEAIPVVNPAKPAALRTLTKKNTTIFRDDVGNQPPPPAVVRPASAMNAPISQNLHTQKSLGQLKTEQQSLRRTESKMLVQQPVETVALSEIETHSVLPAFIDDENYTEYDNMLERYETATGGSEHDADYGVSIGASEVQLDAVERLQKPQSALPALPAPLVASEIEEYWEEDEEEDEIYDEQGYTTAHSYRSRGDNTTGGATTVLFPKVTNKARKELEEAREIVESSRTEEEIEDDLWDTSMVAEYGDDIFQYMRELELKMLPNAHYMENQAEIQWSMRAVLMDWLIQVHHRFTLLPETLFLCVNYVDRFLSCKVVSLGKLQLVGATAIFVAAKYEEINCPSVSEVVFMVDGGYSVDEILKAERFMLTMLQFELGWPGPMSFLRRISKADEYDLDTRTLAKYFLEVAIMDERFVGSPASYTAAGSHCLARMLLKKEAGDWTPAHVYYSGYTWTQLRPLVAMLLQCCENPEKHHSAVFEKFSDRRYKRGSIFVKTELQRGFVLPPLSTPRRSLLAAMDDVGDLTPYEARESFKRMVQIKG